MIARADRSHSDRLEALETQQRVYVDGMDSMSRQIIELSRAVDRLRIDMDSMPAKFEAAVVSALVSASRNPDLTANIGAAVANGVLAATAAGVKKSFLEAVWGAMTGVVGSAKRVVVLVSLLLASAWMLGGRPMFDEVAARLQAIVWPAPK